MDSSLYGPGARKPDWRFSINHPVREASTTEIETVAVDLAKNIFQVHGFTATGERCLVKRLSRNGFQRLMR